MKLKANFHFHSKEDPNDTIPYTLKEGIDEAVRLKFDVLAITLHDKCGYSEEIAQYAAEKDILLISGIEKTIEGRHVVLLNCDSEAELIMSFDDLAAYRRSHPNCFILAPHPYFIIFSLGKKLDQHKSLFDGVEWSWYYSKLFHLANDKAWNFSKKHNKPLIATSDTHRLKYLDRSYVVINTTSKDVLSIIAALRKGSFENVSRPSLFFRDMCLNQIGISLGDEWGRIVSILAKLIKI